MSVGAAEKLAEHCGDEERLAAARSAAYALFARALAYPDAAECEQIRSGARARELQAALLAVAPELAEPCDPAALSDAGRDDALAIEYTRLFDACAGAPPCPLYGGLYGGARMKVMEEAVRFYGFFGLGLSDDPAELPDHLATQLEFLHYLAYREAEALRKGADPEPFRRAQHDFLERHPGAWVPKLCERLERQQPMPFFSELFSALDRLLASELARPVVPTFTPPAAELRS